MLLAKQDKRWNSRMMSSRSPRKQAWGNLEGNAPNVGGGFPDGGHFPLWALSFPPSARVAGHQSTGGRAGAHADVDADGQADAQAATQSETPVRRVPHGAAGWGRGTRRDAAGVSTFSHRASTVPAWIMATCSSFLKFYNTETARASENGWPAGRSPRRAPLWECAPEGHQAHPSGR